MKQVLNYKTSPKDFFLQILAIITLYISSINFLVLIFQYINIFIPDKYSSDNYYNIQSYYNMIRFSIASLIIMFPIYITCTWYLNKSYASENYKSKSRIRRWLIYFTLFAASLIIAGDLIALIFNFLGGELKIRFILKIISVIFVAGSVFTYYFWNIKKYKNE